MEPLGDQLTTHPIQMGWEFTMEPYPSRQFGFIDDPDRQFGNGSVWNRTWTRSDGPEPLLTLGKLPCQWMVDTIAGQRPTTAIHSGFVWILIAAIHNAHIPCGIVDLVTTVALALIPYILVKVYVVEWVEETWGFHQLDQFRVWGFRISTKSPSYSLVWYCYSQSIDGFYCSLGGVWCKQEVTYNTLGLLVVFLIPATRWLSYLLGVAVEVVSISNHADCNSCDHFPVKWAMLGVLWSWRATQH